MTMCRKHFGCPDRCDCPKHLEVCPWCGLHVPSEMPAMGHALIDLLLYVALTGRAPEKLIQLLEGRDMK